MMVGTADIGSLGFAGFQVDLPVVQRAGDPFAVDQTLGQRPALMRAAVVEGENLIVARTKNRNVAFRAGDDPRAKGVDLFQCADIQPVHTDTSRFFTGMTSNSFFSS